ncbi:MAG: universal stress protein [Inquilinus sp.]|nr:universal stress protein [Inquilinus sp.]
MTMKTILAPLAGAARDELTLAGAFTVAQQCEAHVDALFAKLPAAAAVPMLGEGVSGAMVEQLITAAETEWERRETDSRRAFEAAVGSFNMALHEEPPGPTTATAAWREEPGREDEVVVHAGHLSDLVVLGHRRGEDEDIQLALTLEAALFRGSRPVLLVPGVVGQRIGGVAAIAWNGSAEGARAVADAMPFLHQADAVHILTAETGKTDPAVADKLADYLAWHGVLAATRKVTPGSAAVGAALLTAAVDLGADLLVMGGYTHSRLRELILGGVTRHMLAEARLPVLLSH